MNSISAASRHQVMSFCTLAMMLTPNRLITKNSVKKVMEAIWAGIKGSRSFTYPPMEVANRAQAKLPVRQEMAWKPAAIGPMMPETMEYWPPPSRTVPVMNTMGRI